jgi:hypothetical protein
MSTGDGHPMSRDEEPSQIQSLSLPAPLAPGPVPRVRGVQAPEGKASDQAPSRSACQVRDSIPIS